MIITGTVRRMPRILQCMPSALLFLSITETLPVILYLVWGVVILTIVIT